MYAIVDIETTGGHAAANGITEIAIRIHDGEQVVQQYETLINPRIPIPIYIKALTGISDEMVREAPVFEEVAKEVFELLDGRIFVAHNVNFDYSFLKHHLALLGFDLQCKKLCTVRLGRKIFPGLTSYSLGRFCRQMNVMVENRHRAGGDADATAKLFSLMLQNDAEGHISVSLSKISKEQNLPPNLSKEDINALPYRPGVYYFRDQKGKVIYVGKAKNLRKRVLSHFTGNNAGRQRQEFLRNIYSIAFEECATELMAFILEAIEIKRLWPANNRAMKQFEQTYGLYSYEDQKGYIRLAIDKKKKHCTPLYSFNSSLDGHNKLISVMKQFQLCPKLCFIQKHNGPCAGLATKHCLGACETRESAESYNSRVRDAILHLKSSLPSFGYLDAGRSRDEFSIILMEEGKLFGMGYVQASVDLQNVEAIKPYLKQYPSNDYIRNLIQSYALRFPEKMVFC